MKGKWVHSCQGNEAKGDACCLQLVLATDCMERGTGLADMGTVAATSLIRTYKFCMFVLNSCTVWVSCPLAAGICQGRRFESSLRISWLSCSVLGSRRMIPRLGKGAHSV